VIDDHFWVGMFLVDASAAPSEALRAYVWVVGREDASNFSATTWATLDDTEYNTVECKRDGRGGEVKA
jgi:hypothetical protein